MIDRQNDNIINKSEIISPRRYLSLIGILAIGGLVSFILFIFVNNWEYERQRIEFESRSMGYANAVQNNLLGYEQALRFLGDFFNNSELVTREEFSDFVMNVIARSPSIQAFSWNPLILNSERAKYESRAQEEGFENFMFKERTEENELVRAAQRDEYVIVYYIEPLADNEPAFGYDIASNPTRLKAINYGFDTGELSATDRITLVQEAGEQFGILLLLPIYKQNVPLKTTEDRQKHRKGFVVEVLRVGDVIENALKNFSDEGINIYLYDLSADEAKRFLYFRPSRVSGITKNPQQKDNNQKGLYWSKTFDFAGRQWQVLFSPSSYYFDSQQSWHAWFVLSGSLLLTCLLAFYISRKAIYTADIEQRVKKQAETNLELKKAIREQKKLEGQLVQAQKMEAVGQLAGGIAHDFNNILTAIIGYGNLMQMKMKEDDPLRMNIDHILNSAERAARLIQSLLAFSRKQIINPQPIDLNEIVTRVEKLLLRVIGEDIKLTTICREEAVTVMADSGHIEQVLMNLATNARDAMPEGGILSIETGLVEIDDELIKTHGYGKQGKYAFISVTDSGVGMDEETRQKIFEPFFTTKEVDKGTGLGLSVIYGIIKQHDGFIDVYSEPGKGTKFKIYLPQIKAGIKEAAKTELFSVEKGTETVLVAEDNESVRRLIKDILQQYGYKVIEAGDGEEAIENYKEQEEEIDLLLLDVIMPKRNGKEVYEEIKGMKPDVKALFLSGYSEDLLQKKGVLEKGINFIFKPVAVNDLLRKVRGVLDK
jgi:signal transduction histidine kinase/CheY-like chemotaxis protein